jgi:hypothetical protein
MRPNTPAGGLSRGQLLLLLARAMNRTTTTYVVVIIALLAFQLSVSFQRASWARVAAVGFVALLVIAYLIAPMLRNGRALRTVSPEAADAIAAGLAAAGLPAPDRLTVQARPFVSALIRVLPDRRATLAVGLPVVMAQPTADLPALAAYELAVAAEPYPILAGALWRRRKDLEDLGDLLRGKQTSRARRVAALLSDTDRFTRDLRARSDAAAAAVAGSADAAAAALYRNEALAVEFIDFTGRFRRLILKKQRIPAHLHAGWHASRRDGIAPWERLLAPDLDRFFDEHPGLSRADRAPLRAIPEQLRGAATSPTAAYTLTARTERALSVLMARQFLPSKPIRPIDEADLDLALVYPEGSADDSVLIEAAAVLQGGTPTRAEVFDLVRGPRLRELAVPLLGAEDRDDPEGGLSRGLLLAWLVTAAQHDRGLRQRDPMRPRVLTADDGTAFDVAAHVTEALADDVAAARLRVLVAAEPAPHAQGPDSPERAVSTT